MTAGQVCFGQVLLLPAQPPPAGWTTQDKTDNDPMEELDQAMTSVAREHIYVSGNLQGTRRLAD